VKYSYTGPGAENSTFRVAVVGKGREGVWIELGSGTAGNRKIVKLMVQDISPSSMTVTRLMFKADRAQAVELPAANLETILGMLGLDLDGSLLSGAVGLSPRDFEKVGEGRMRIGSARFAVERYRYTGKGEECQVWGSRKLPLWGVARVETGRGKMEIIDFGKGAQTEIRERPVKVNIPFLISPGNPRR